MQPIINPLYPLGPVRNVDELMAIAVGMEHEAALRYEHLADAMLARRDDALATAFRQLAQLERDHEQGLARWAEREGWQRPQPAVFSWRLPETFGGEADGWAAATLTPYRALGIAVANEERAFTFYTYIAAMADDPALKLRAEGLAREELDHVRHLRTMRRRAFHADRSAASDLPRPRTADGLAAMAKGMEGASAELAETAAAVLAAAGDAAAASLLRQQGGAARLRADSLTDAAPAPGWGVAEAARSAGLVDSRALTPDGALRLFLRNAEETAEAYLAAADAAADAPMLALAQELAEQAVARLAVVRSLSSR